MGDLRTCRRCGERYPLDEAYFPLESRGDFSYLCHDCREERPAEKHPRKSPRPLTPRDPLLDRAARIRASMQKRARQNGIPFDAGTLSVEYIAQRLRESPRCCCCGRPFSWSPPDGGIDEAVPTLDRIHSSRGYTPGNVAVVCYRCNRLKSDGTIRDFDAVSRYLREYQGPPWKVAL